MLEQLKERMHQHPHLFSREPLPLEEWIDKDKPYIWIKIEKAGDYTLFEDTGYGHLALFRNKRLVDVGNNFVRHGNIIGLSDYYTGGSGLYKKI